MEKNELKQLKNEIIEEKKKVIDSWNILKNEVSMEELQKMIKESALDDNVSDYTIGLS